MDTGGFPAPTSQQTAFFVSLQLGENNGANLLLGHGRFRTQKSAVGRPWVTAFPASGFSASTTASGSKAFPASSSAVPEVMVSRVGEILPDRETHMAKAFFVQYSDQICRALPPARQGRSGFRRIFARLDLQLLPWMLISAGASSQEVPRRLQK